MEEIAGSFTPLLIVISLAFIVPLLLTRFKRLRLPIVVGEILAGIVVGSSGFGWVTHEDQLLTLLAEFGFVFLMFLAGMEIDFANLNIELPGVARAGGTRTDLTSSQRRERRAFGPLSISLMGFILTLSLSAIVGFALLQVGLVSSPWMMALIMSTTSLGVVMPVLKEQELIRGRFGQTILIAALVADFATMILITVVIATISHGLTLDILLISLLFVVFFLLYRLGIVSLNRFESLRRTLEDLSHTTARIKIRGAFTIMLLFVVLAEVLGAEIILGAFIAGAMLSLLSTREDLEAMHQLEAVGFGFFIPIFFIMVGVNFNLGALLELNRRVDPAALPCPGRLSGQNPARPSFPPAVQLARDLFRRLSPLLPPLTDRRRLGHRPQYGDHQRIGQHHNHSRGNRHRHRRPPGLQPHRPPHFYGCAAAHRRLRRRKARTPGR